jgi:hypothetical protein
MRPEHRGAGPILSATHGRTPKDGRSREARICRLAGGAISGASRYGKPHHSPNGEHATAGCRTHCRRTRAKATASFTHRESAAARRPNASNLLPGGSANAWYAALLVKKLPQPVKGLGRCPAFLLGRVLINAQIAASLVAEFVQKSGGLSKKQQLTGLFCKRDARNGCSGLGWRVIHNEGKTALLDWRAGTCDHVR